MDTATLLTQLPIIMGLSSAALILILIATPFTTLCIYSSHYSLPAIKSMCVEYVCSMWSLLSHPADHPIIITPRNIFLLVNLIIVFLFISMHLQQHAPAADKRSLRKKRQQRTQKLIMNDARGLQPLQEGSSLADYLAASAAATAMENEALSISSACAAELRPLQDSMERLNGELPQSVDEASMAMESLIAEAAPMQESFVAAASNESLAAEMKGRSLAPISPTVDSDHINGLDVEQIVLDEDGRLRLIEGPISPKGSDANKESTNGSDAETIVLEEDGRLRLIDRPLPSSCRPEKSLSDNYYNNHNAYYDANNHNAYYDTNSLNNFNKYDDIHSLNNNHNFNNDTYSLDYNRDSLDLNHNDQSKLNEGNNGTLDLDYNSNPDLNHDDAHQSTLSNKSSSLKRTISKPIRVKKSDSLDATWKAINHNKGSAVNATNRDQKHLIRQSSRKDFKPSRGGKGLMRDTTYKVRREPSISQDDLNAKVESFIAKFNEQIRIERQESILSYMQMVDRGA